VSPALVPFDFSWPMAKSNSTPSEIGCGEKQMRMSEITLLARLLYFVIKNLGPFGNRPFASVPFLFLFIFKSRLLSLQSYTLC
jgi:hypothetical protein